MRQKLTQSPTVLISTHQFLVLLLSVLLLCFASESHSQPRGMNPKFGWGWEKVEFESLDPERTKLFLHFKLRGRTAQSVVIGHDSGGITDNEQAYADYLHGKGFNVFLTDRITSRGRVALPYELYLIEDAFATSAFIRSSFAEKIDLQNLSYVSFSGDGGLGGLMSIEPVVRAKFSEMTGVNEALFRYKSVVAIYPHCGGLIGSNPDTPTLIIGAELDASSPDVCKKVYADYPIVRVDIYEGMPHGFDQFKLKGRQFINKPFNYPGTCVLTLDVRERNDWQGHRYFLQSLNGVRQRTRLFGEEKKNCEHPEKGYWSFYDKAATTRAFEESVKFISQ
jgi:dienelactone hydrolase